MKLIINNKETETDALTVGALSEELRLPERGVALAIGNMVVARHDWDSTSLHENDNIVIIKAVCGG